MGEEIRHVSAASLSQGGLFVLVGLGIALALIPWLRRGGLERRYGRRGWDFHQTHEHPVSRLGGLALATAFGVVALGGHWLGTATGRPAGELALMVGGALAMFLVGFWDDLRPLGARRKLLFQILIATAVYAGGLRIEVVTNPFAAGPVHLGFWSWPVTVLWLVGFTNLINLVDGMDGLAGGISLMLMGLLAFVGYQSGQYFVVTAGMMGALAGFLIFNFPPARIYLGDGGAYLLGFLFGELSIVTSHKGTVVAALLAPLLVLALPLVDVSLTILRRALRGLPLFRADRQHLHHRLLEMGLTRQQVAAWFYAVTLFFLGLGIAVFLLQDRLMPLVVGLGVLGVILVLAQFSFAQEWFRLPFNLGHSLRVRSQVGYALALVRWLELENERVACEEEYWQLFQLAAWRLGFYRLRVELADGVREWTCGPDRDADSLQVVRYDFRRDQAGIIELGALRCPPQVANWSADCEQFCQRAGFCVSEPKTFGIVAELLAEAWYKARQRLRERGVPTVPARQPAESESHSPEASSGEMRTRAGTGDAIIERAQG